MTKVEIDSLKRKEKYQKIPDLTETEYDSLKSDIKENGVTDAIHIDEGNNVLDGHNRVLICEELGIAEIKADRHSTLSDEEKEDFQFRSNGNRRNMGESRKKDFIEARFLVLDGRGEHQTDQQIADYLGVGKSWVNEVKLSLIEDDKFSGGGKFATRSSKREQAENYIEQNPDASNRDVASETPVSRTTEKGDAKFVLEEGGIRITVVVVGNSEDQNAILVTTWLNATDRKKAEEYWGVEMAVCGAEY